jgi:hypothetical protein
LLLDGQFVWGSVNDDNDDGGGGADVYKHWLDTY